LAFGGGRKDDRNTAAYPNTLRGRNRKRSQPLTSDGALRVASTPRVQHLSLTQTKTEEKNGDQMWEGSLPRRQKAKKKGTTERQSFLYDNRKNKSPGF